MGKTISTHNGSTANRDHNIRNPKATDKQEHIDKALKRQNEILHDEKPREAYKRIFGQALEAYNAKQERPERQIRDYYAHVSKDAKKHPVYEMIVQIGDRNDTGIHAPVERECLKEFYAGWKDRNPNLECIGAYIHADETDGTIHMHLDYVPVATGYKRGLEVQNGLVKALEQQGFEKSGKLTAQIQWEARENAVLESICNQHGIEVVHPKKEGVKHLDTETYKAEKKLEELQEDVLIAEEKAEGYQEIAITYQEQAETAQEELLLAKQEITSLQADKTALEGEIEGLEQLKDKATDMAEQANEVLVGFKPKLAEMMEQKAEMERELPVLQEQISEAKKELRTVQKAIEEKMEMGSSLMSHSTLQEQIRLVKERDKEKERMSFLERQIERFERFLNAVPAARELWKSWNNDEHGRRKMLSQDKPVKNRRGGPEL